MWDLNFNTSKCCILHFGHSNVQSPYSINNNRLISKRCEKDLGVLFSTNFKFNEHIDTITCKANRQLGIIARVFKQRDLKTIVPLYKSFVRPFLEFNSVIWSPYLKVQVQKLERIQEKMCNLMISNRRLSYEEKLKKCKLHSLLARRIKQQLTIMFKMKFNLIDLCFEDFFLENNYRKTRGNIFKLKIPKSKTKHRLNYFTCSIVKHWNQLKSSDINVCTVASFKKNVDKYLRNKKIL